MTYNWYKSYFGKRTVRVTLLGKQCDLSIGLPSSDDFMGPAVLFSKPIGRFAYALVGRKELAIRSIDDLKGKRVAVQYQTTPQDLLAPRDDIEKKTVLTPEEGMEALDKGEVDIAFIWGPVAGWLNKTLYGERFQVTPTEGNGLSWEAAIGFAKTSKELRDQVDVVLPQLDTVIAELAKKYGIPTDKPIRLTQAGIGKEVAARALVQPNADRAADAVPASNTVGSSAELVNSGHEIFNGTCAHCHGPDAVQSERRIDLRLLTRRYADDTRTRFWVTVHEGRPAKGMPAWKDVFTDEQLENVYAYLMSIQTPTDSAN